MTTGSGGSGGATGSGGAGGGAAGSIAAEPPDYPAIAWLLVSAAGLAACITLLFLGMRAVMDIGGACASGGPSVSVRPCPDGIAALMPVGTLGLFVFGGLGIWAGARVGGGWAALPFLAWPGLFVSLGWNFLEYGLRPPGDAPGPALGWLFCGAVFVVMGAVPLWIAISARNELREEGGRAVASRYFPPRTRAGSATPPGPAKPHDEIADDADPDLVTKLERLADLRRRGDITTEEFEAAKRLLLGENQ
jgi:putative oligomerization/nucleic acid binding protein